MKLKNKDEIIECLAEIMLKLDIEKRSYQTDIYAYYNHETCTLKLVEFENPSGNSNIDDDHYVIYVDHEHYETIFETSIFECFWQVADALDMTIIELVTETSDSCGIPSEDLTEDDIYDYIKTKDVYMEKLHEVYAYIVKDYYMSDYRDIAECCVDNLIRRM